MRCWAGDDSRSFAMSWKASADLQYGGRRRTNVDVVLKLNPPRTVQLNLLQGLPHDIVWLPLGALCALNSCCLVQVATVFYVELAKGILEAEDLTLLELGIFAFKPSAAGIYQGGSAKRELTVVT